MSSLRLIASAINSGLLIADGDALATARVLVRLLDEASARGARDLDALEGLLGRVPPGRRKRRRRQLPKGHA